MGFDNSLTFQITETHSNKYTYVYVNYISVVKERSAPKYGTVWWFYLLIYKLIIFCYIFFIEPKYSNVS